VWDPDQKKFVTGEIKVHIPCGHWHTPQGSGGGGGNGGEGNVTAIYLVGHTHITKATGSDVWRIEKLDFDLNGIWLNEFAVSAYPDVQEARAIGKVGTTLYIGGYSGDAYANEVATLCTLDDATGTQIIAPYLIDTFGSAGKRSMISFNSMEVDSNGLYILVWGWLATGYTRIEKRSLDFTVQTWSVSLPDFWGGNSAGCLTTDDNFIYIAYSTRDSEGYPIYTHWRVAKYSKTDGSNIWDVTHVFSGTTPYSADPIFIEVDATGIYLGGNLNYDGASPTDWYIEKRSLVDGSVIWSDRVADTNLYYLDCVQDGAVDDDYLYVVGHYGYTWPNPKYRAEKRNKTTGVVESFLSYYGTFNRFRCCTHESIDNVFTCHGGELPVYDDIAVIKTLPKDMSAFSDTMTTTSDEPVWFDIVISDMEVF
jgi:hypothetical protein